MVAYWAVVMLAPKSTQAEAALASEKAVMILVNRILEDVALDFEGVGDWKLDILVMLMYGTNVVTTKENYRHRRATKINSPKHCYLQEN